MKHKWLTVIFALAEIIIGSVTLIAVILSLIQGKSTKPPEVLVFVLTTAIISLGLGFGIFRYNLTSYHLLLYLSSIIILSKILIFAKIITLSGELETIIPASLKNVVSILYHGLLIFWFTRKSVREQFGERRNFFSFLKMPFFKK
jgi:hypothetical protein